MSTSDSEAKAIGGPSLAQRTRQQIQELKENEEAWERYLCEAESTFVTDGID